MNQPNNQPIYQQTPQQVNQPYQAPQQIIVQQKKQSNGMGTAGFVLSLIGLVLCWAPVLDWILWALGGLFSFIGIFKKPSGMATAGLIISFFTLLILIFLHSFLAALVA